MGFTVIGQFMDKLLEVIAILHDFSELIRLAFTEKNNCFIYVFFHFVVWVGNIENLH
jgi:hypothetical protein